MRSVVKALVGDMTKSVDIVRKPCESPRQRRRENEDVGRSVDQDADRWRQLVDVSNRRVCDEQQPRDGAFTLPRGEIGGSTSRLLIRGLLAARSQAVMSPRRIA